MRKKMALRRVGGAIVTTIPKVMLDRLQLKEGDAIYAVETEAGILLTPHDQDFEDAMKAFDKLNRMYREALKELAKR